MCNVNLFEILQDNTHVIHYFLRFTVTVDTDTVFSMHKNVEYFNFAVNS